MAPPRRREYFFLRENLPDQQRGGPRVPGENFGLLSNAASGCQRLRQEGAGVTKNQDALFYGNFT